VTALQAVGYSRPVHAAFPVAPARMQREPPESVAVDEDVSDVSQQIGVLTQVSQLA